MTRVRISPAVVVLAVAVALVWWGMPAAAQMPVEVPDLLDEEEEEDGASGEEASDSEGTEGATGAAPTDEAAELAPDPAPDPAPAPAEPQPPPEPQEPTPDEQAAEQRRAPVSGMASGPRLQSRPMPDSPAPPEGGGEPVRAPQVADPESVPGVSVAPPAEEEEPAAAEREQKAPETTESMDKISVASGEPSSDGQRQAMPTLAILMVLAVGLAWNDWRQRSRLRHL